MGRTVAIVAAAMAFAMLPLSAQNPSSAASPRLDDVLYNAADALGMLRGVREQDAVVTLEHWASGRGTTGGQTYDIPNFRASYNFKDVNGPGVRIDVTRVGSDGTSVREIQVVSGRYAWNETEPGVNPSPVPAALNERLLRFWSHPFGVVKAATAAGPMAKVFMEDGAIVLTCPLPMAGATLKATLNRQYQSERVETRMGNLLVETSYSDYKDWNWPDYQSDVMTPGRIVQKQNGITILDLTTKATNTYNPYVILTVPRQIQSASVIQR